MLVKRWSWLALLLLASIFSLPWSVAEAAEQEPNSPVHTVYAYYGALAEGDFAAVIPLISSDSPLAPEEVAGFLQSLFAEQEIAITDYRVKKVELSEDSPVLAEATVKLKERVAGGKGILTESMVLQQEEGVWKVLFAEVVKSTGSR